MRTDGPGGTSTDEWPRVRTVSTSDGGTVSYAEYGTPGGHPVVFLHRTPRSHVLGRVLHDDAVELGVHLLAINRPGFGTSPPRPTRTFRTTAEFVAPVMEAAGMASATMVGFSGGGPHALAVAATRPELVTAVDVVSGTAPPELTDDAPRIQRGLGVLARTAPRLLQGLFRGQARVAKRASPSFVVSQYTDAAGRDELSDGVAEIVKRDFLEAFATYRRGAVTESRLLTRRWDVPLDRVRQPVRLWHGRRDANVPFEASRRLRDRLPNAELVAFDDSDHLSTLLRCKNRVLSTAAAETDGAARR